jgi:membrane protease YdiL (CAAX protease family)
MQASSVYVRGIELLLLALPVIACLSIPGPGVIAAALIVTGVLIARRDVRSVVLDLWWRGPPASVALGIAAGVSINVFVQIIVDPLIHYLLNSKAQVSALGSISGDLRGYIQLLAIGLLFGGIAEELVFRGFLIGWSTRLLGERAILPSVVLSSALFGYSHLYQGLAGVIETAIVGLLLAILYVKAGRRLSPSSFAHMTIDAIGITDLYLNGAITEFFTRHVAWL